MDDHHLHSLLVNAVVFNEDKVLVSQRSFEEKHMPGAWTIPGGKVDLTEGNVFHILEHNVKKEVLEETGIEIEDTMEMVTNNTFIRGSNNQHVVVIVFKCIYKSGDAKALEDTIDCKWVSKDEVTKMQFPPNVKEYILSAFDL
jgi:8-oxo-dGTP pyrophosphatase MutT (NUDIX family)